MIKALQDSSPGVLLGRVLIAAIVVFSTYNPTGKSIYHWIVNSENMMDAWIILVAVVTVLIHIALLVAAWNALGKLGTIIVAILFAALIYLSLQEGWVSSDNRDSVQWLGLILYSVFLGIGLAGAIIWRRATGQVVVDDIEN